MPASPSKPFDLHPELRAPLESKKNETFGTTSALAGPLKYEFRDAWFPNFRLLLGSGDPRLAPILARAFGYRRMQCGPQLLAAINKKVCCAGFARTCLGTRVHPLRPGFGMSP